MMEIATDALLAAGIPASSIHYERFDYAAGKGQARSGTAHRSSFPLPDNAGCSNDCFQPEVTTTTAPQLADSR